MVRWTLRARLTLAFAVLAWIPLAVLVPWSVVHLRSALRVELSTRADFADAVARAAFTELQAQTHRSILELSRSTALETLARTLHDGGDPSALSAEGDALMRSRGLEVLSILDATGKIISSGHLPASVGEVDPTLFALTRVPGQVRTATVQVQGPNGLERVPAVLCASPVDYGDLRVWVVGGRRLDGAFLDHLAALTGGRVTLHFADTAPVGEGTAEPPVVERKLPLPNGGSLSVALSQSAITRAEKGLWLAFFALCLLALLAAMAVGAWMAKRITRPVVALTAGARRISEGDWTTEVSAPAKGEIEELIATFNGMTARLRTTTEKLVRAERVAAWEEIARRLAHELKNPLTPIQMSLETLIAAREANHERFDSLFRESAQAMLEEVGRLRRTIDAFSRFARLPKPARTPMDLAEWAHGLLSLHAAPREGIRIEQALSGPLPVEADRDQLTQVLVNLLKNAEEAMPGGGRIEIRAFAENGLAVLEVEDEGPGIPEADRARILEPYVTTKAGGTGLGLAIAARILQEHDGRLEVREGRSGGACFRLVLPSRTSEVREGRPAIA